MYLQPSLRSVRWLNSYILIVIYFAVAAASFNGFFYKWALRDGQARFSIEQMLDGTADRPFVYRQLIPFLANHVEAVISERSKQKLIAAIEAPLESTGRLYTQVVSKTAADPRYLIRYHVVYYLCFSSLFAAIFAMRRLCLNAGFDEVSSSLAPVLFTLFFPFIQTNGGYFYDLPELFFLTAAMAAALGRRSWWLVPLTLLGTLNKESFLLFLPALFPLLRTRLTTRKTIALLSCLIAIAGVLNLIVHAHYRNSPGGVAELNFLQNLRSYVSYKMLFRVESNYGILTLRGYSILSIVLLWAVAAGSWHRLASPFRQHAAIAAAINVPLFLVLGVYGELRGLSFLYGTLLLLIAAGVSRWIQDSSGVRRSPVGEEIYSEEAVSSAQ